MATLLLLHPCLLLITVSSLLFIIVQSETYIVHMDVTAMPESFTDHHSWYAATLSSLSTDDSRQSTTGSPNLIYAYTHVVRGFSATLSNTELQSLEKSPGFISWSKDVPVTPHTTRTPQFLGLNSASGAWPQSNYGENVIIGVIDSGVWPESESFRDVGMSKIPSRWKGKCVKDISFKSSMCNKKLIGARSFNKALLANEPNSASSVNSTRDTDGHGTHISAIAAGNAVEGASFFDYANGTASGIAPHAHLAIYKVIWDRRSYTADIIAAIDQAIDDGVDVLSISMGWEADSLDKDPIAIATFSAMEKGIFIATSAGNSGPFDYTVQNGAPWVVTVGAGSIDRTPSAIMSLNNGVTIVGTALYLEGAVILTVPLVFLGECQDIDRLKKVDNNIVVCKGEDDDVRDQIQNIEAAQALVAIFISRNQKLESLIPTPFPAVFLNPEQGQIILNYINSSKDASVSMQFHHTQIGTKPAPIVGQYSSRGPSKSNPSILKPDLIAPGTLVLSSWSKVSPVVDFGSRQVFSPFNLIWGTSLACPHVAGVAALLKGVHPEWSPAAIRSAMITTADSLDNTHSPIKDFGYSLAPANTLALGAGHINPNKALNPGLVYDANAEDYVSFLCSIGYTKNQIMTITRSTGFDCSNASSDLNYPSFIAFFNGSTSNMKIVQRFRRTVTNVGEKMSTYTARLTHMNELELSVVPNTLAFKKKYEKLSFTLTIKGPTKLNNQVIDGSLQWVDVGGKHVVRSPIVATSINLNEVSD